MIVHNILRLKNIKSKHRYNTTRHPKNKAALFFLDFHLCVFYSSPLSLISQWIPPNSIPFHVVMAVIVLGAPNGKCGVRGMRLTRVLVLRIQIELPFVKKALFSLV